MKWKKILFLFLTVVFVFVSNFDFVYSDTTTRPYVYTQNGGDRYINNSRIVEGRSSVTGSTKFYYYRTEDGNFYQGLRSGSGYNVMPISEASYNTIPGGATTDPNVWDYTWRELTGTEDLSVSPEEIMRNTVSSAISKAFSGQLEIIPQMLLKFIVFIAQDIILRLAAWFAGLSGLLFDAVLKFTVLNMANTVNSGFIDLGWKIMRDIVNIMFIFVLLFIGIMTIIKGFESGTSKKIATVIVVALLINFSLFFTKIIIDSSNIIAVQFYESIKGQATSNEWAGIAAQFIEATKATSIYGSKSQPATGNTGHDTQLIIIAIGGSIILVVLGIIIFIASALFVTRFIVLIFVLIASSAAIGSFIVPKLKAAIWDKWWGALIGQSFFAPLLLLFLYIDLLFVRGLQQLNNTSGFTWESLFTGNPSQGIGLIVNYVVIVGSLIGAIAFSKTLSDMSGDGAGKITSFVGGGVLGATAWMGRNSIGRVGKVITESDRLKRYASSNIIGLRNISRGALLAGNKAAQSTFDARGSKVFGAVAGKTKVDLGKAGEMTYQKNIDEKAKEYGKMADERGKLYGIKMPEGKDLKAQVAAKKLSDDKYKKLLNEIQGDPSVAGDTGAKGAVRDASVQVELAKHNFDTLKKIRSTSPAALQAAAENLADRKATLETANKELSDLMRRESEWVTNAEGEIKTAASLLGEWNKPSILRPGSVVLKKEASSDMSARDKAFKDSAKKYGWKDADKMVDAFKSANKS